MGQTADQIENHIEVTRDTLGSNLQELEQKVKAVTDWKQHFQNHPMTLIGAAFGGGVLLATMLGGGRKEKVRRSFSSAPPPEYAGAAHQKHQALETWDNIKGALIGAAASQFKNYVGEIIPGFAEQFERTKSEQAKVHRSQEVH